MPFKNADDRRKYQNGYYKAADQKKRRSRNAKDHRERRRKRIYERDNYTCYYCRKRKAAADLQIDHIIPINRPNHPVTGRRMWVKGGSPSSKKRDSGYRTACKGCNSQRGNKPVCSECRMWTKPVRRPDGRLMCVECGSLPSYPEGTRAVNDPPEWVESETVEASDETDSENLRYA